MVPWRVQSHFFPALNQDDLRIVDGDFDGTKVEISQRLLDRQFYAVVWIGCVHDGPHLPVV